MDRHLSGYIRMRDAQDVLLSCRQLCILTVLSHASAFQLYNLVYWPTLRTGMDQDVPGANKEIHIAALLIQCPSAGLGHVCVRTQADAPACRVGAISIPNRRCTEHPGASWRHIIV